LKTIEKAATKSRAKAKHADSPAANSVNAELVEGFITTLGTITKPRKEKVQPSEHSDLSYIGLEHVESETTRLLGSISATEMRSAANRYYLNDVLYSRLRPYLNKVHRASDAGLCSSEFIVFPENGNIAPDFLRYRLNANDFVSFANSLDAGDRPRVNFEQISAFKLWCPPLRTQHRIVAEIEEKLSRLDAAQSALLRAQANLKRYRASALDRAFSNLSGTKALAELCTKITDGTHHSPTSYSSGDYLYLTAKNIQWHGIDLSNATYIDSKTHDEIYSRCDVQYRDVLLVKDGATTGRLALNTLKTPFSLLSSVGVLRCSENLSPEYLIYALQSPKIRDAIQAQIAGVAITRLTLKKIKSLVIPITSLAAQLRIVSSLERRLSIIDRTEQTLRTQLERAKRLRQSILQQAFSQ
jgi:type I restriction enzyme, S subunit